MPTDHRILLSDHGSIRDYPVGHAGLTTDQESVMELIKFLEKNLCQKTKKVPTGWVEIHRFTEKIA